jgi:Na+/H+ antiporter NhaD/arsenite permease-like protein
MEIIGFIAAGVFIFGYLLIALEQKFSTHKSAIALIMAGVLWTLAAFVGNGTEAFTHISNETAVNVFSVVAFSLASMALIEILAHYRFFDWIRMQLLRLKLRDKQQFILMMAMCFMLSGFLDNISLTICMILVARRFFTGKNLLVTAAAVVIASNAGGAWSVIGDVTSLLLWLGDKVSAFGLIKYAFIPTAVLTVTAGYLLYRQLDPTDFVKHESDEKIELSTSEKIVIISAIGAFILPIVVNIIGVQPYIGRLFGLGITWALVELAKTQSRRPHESHMSANIERIIQSVDLSSIKFLTGILLSVGALTSLGVLAYLSQIALGDNPSEGWILTLSSLLGLMSGVVDNSALVAIAMQVFPPGNEEMWSLVSITAGTGGSILIFASAAGIVAMGSLKELTFQAYLKIATIPALVGLAAAVGVWFIQYTLF